MDARKSPLHLREKLVDGIHKNEDLLRDERDQARERDADVLRGP